MAKSSAKSSTSDGSSASAAGGVTKVPASGLPVRVAAPVQVESKTEKPATLAPAQTAAAADAAARLDPTKSIRVRGAKEHNLKNIDVDIPRDKLVVITGLSGSGKSSLAFDTIFAEGQRKYMESLSAYARQFLDQLKKPDVEDIQGLPPTIAIEQRSSGHNPRSTVATSTEIYDYLRLLFARCGSPTCWFPTKTKKDGTVLERCGRPIHATPSSQIIDAVMNFATVDGTKIMVLAPVVRAKKGFHRDVLEELQKQGWGRVRVNGALVEIREALKDEGENPLKLARYEKHDVEAVIDRLVLKTGQGELRQRLAESVEAALKLADQTVFVAVEKSPEKWESHVFSAKFACAEHPSCALEELSPRLFSFNSPHGACPECHGLGIIMEFSEALCFPDEDKSLAEGAIHPWRVPPPMGRIFRKRVKQFCEDFGVSPHAPVATFSKQVRDVLMNGTKGGAMGSEEKRGAPKFIGVGPSLRQWYERTESAWMREWLGAYMSEKTCPTCAGDRLKIESLHVLMRGGGIGRPAPGHRREEKKASANAESRVPNAGTLNIAQFARLNIRDAMDFAANLDLSTEQRTIAEPILKEISARLRFLVSVGLEYLSLDRRTSTLSGGEAQRIRLATQVGSGLVGACYVLDEPTIGLHQRDNDRLIATLRHLTDIGNSVLVVEHDEDMIRQADWVVDVGPGPGVHGGRIVAQGSVADIIAQSGSITGEYLARTRRIDVPARRRELNPKRAITIKGARQNNLKNVDAAFPLGGLVCVTGVSGSGKSTLVNDILLAGLKRSLNGGKSIPGAHDKILGLNLIDRVIEVDQSPIGRTPRSNPATYTGVFDDIRKVFTDTKEAKIRGYKVGRFSFNVPAKSGGGRCEACEGQGLKKIEMHFLPDVYVACEVCGGSRYNRETLEVRFRSKSIADVLDMTVEEGAVFFENHPRILKHMLCLRDVGLNYVKLGQPSTQLSGGEAQRIKLATELAKGPLDTGIPRGDEEKAKEEVAEEDAKPKHWKAKLTATPSHTLYILDEPTTGLHFEDIRKLVGVMNRLADAGNTLVVIEHNLDVIKCADWIVDLGPEGGDNGGTIVAVGTPEEVAGNGKSFTGAYLKGVLKG